MGTANQINIFLLLFGGLQGLLLAILLVQKKTYRSAYRVLIAYILVMILQILSKVVSKSWLMGNSELLYFMSYQLPFLYGPLAYLLVLQLRQPDKNLSPAHGLHFVPFAVTATATVLNLMFRYSGASAATAMLTDVRITLWLHLMSIAGYHFLAFRLLTSSSIDPYKPPAAEAHWLKRFVLASAVVSMAIAFSIFFLYVTFPRMSELRWLFGSLTIFIYWITYSALKQPELFKVIRGGSAGGPPLQINLKVSVGREKLRYSGSTLTAEGAIAISTTLNSLMTARKMYLDPDVSLDKLAAKIGCSRHHLSQVINEKEGSSFYDYVNRFRIEEATLQLSDPHQQNKIATIAFASGFNSLSAFNDVFKKTTGMTPSDYRKQALPSRRKQV